MHRDANRSRLVGDGAGNGLTNPPRRVGRELIAPAVLELVHGLHQADVALLDQIQELQAAVRVLLRNADHQSQVRLNQLALGVLGVHVSLDDLALRPLQLAEHRARLHLDALHVGAHRADLLADFLLLLLDLGELAALFQVQYLAVQGLHVLDRLVHTVNQPLALLVGKAQCADRPADFDLLASQSPVGLAMVANLLLVLARLSDVGQFRNQDYGLLVMLGQLVHLAGDLLQAALQNLVGNLLFVEDHDFFHGAHLALHVVANGQHLADDDGRARQCLQHAQLPALNALGNFHFALASQQRNRSHLAQIHAHRVVGLFQGARSQVQLDVLAFFLIRLELLLRGQLRVFQHVDALGADNAKQVV